MLPSLFILYRRFYRKLETATAGIFVISGISSTALSITYNGTDVIAAQAVILPAEKTAKKSADSYTCKL